MKVRNVLLQAAANLGRDDLVAAINDCFAEPEGDVASLLRCYNLVENELALDYFPLKREELVCACKGVVPYRRFRFAPARILSVERDGIPVPFEARPASLRLGDCRGGKYLVSYTYTPAEKCLFAECEVGGKISVRLLSFGVACEFCLCHGAFQEAATWEKKYREALAAANLVRRKLSVRGRRWA